MNWVLRSLNPSFWLLLENEPTLPAPNSSDWDGLSSKACSIKQSSSPRNRLCAKALPFMFCDFCRISRNQRWPVNVVHMFIFASFFWWDSPFYDRRTLWKERPVEIFKTFRRIKYINAPSPILAHPNLFCRIKREKSQNDPKTKVSYFIYTVCPKLN